MVRSSRDGRLAGRGTPSALADPALSAVSEPRERLSRLPGVGVDDEAGPGRPLNSSPPPLPGRRPCRSQKIARPRDDSGHSALAAGTSRAHLATTPGARWTMFRRKAAWRSSLRPAISPTVALLGVVLPEVAVAPSHQARLGLRTRQARAAEFRGATCSWPFVNHRSAQVGGSNGCHWSAGRWRRSAITANAAGL